MATIQTTHSKQTWTLLPASDFPSPFSNLLAPASGIPLYERPNREQRLIHDPWWLHPDFRNGQSMVHPTRMTAQQVAEGCYWTRMQFNKYRAILRHALDFRANCRNPYNAGIYLTVNLINKREIQQKWGSLWGMVAS